ncbi:MAG: lipoyl(octanoyl) transferase LipB [Phycisphaerae bacterium]
MNGITFSAALDQRRFGNLGAQAAASACKIPLLTVVDLGVMEYRAAWNIQLHWHEKVRIGQCAAGVLLLVEHPPVITIGRHPGAETHLLADAAVLAQKGVAVETTDRGGDITFHGPGQLVMYPIIPLNEYNLGIHDYMRILEAAVIRTLAEFHLHGRLDAGATGVWLQSTRGGADGLAKLCAIGIKLRRWISLHGLALNVTTDLAYFDLINPCGLGRPVTSLAAELGAQCPPINAVKPALVREISVLLMNPDPASRGAAKT